MMDNLRYGNKWMGLHEDDHGEAFVTMGKDAVIIVALTVDHLVLLVREKSIAYQADMLALPMGGVEPSESLAVTVNRELQEETGYRAENIEYLGTLHPSIKYMRWECHVHLAHNLTVSRLPGDEISPVLVIPIPIQAIGRLIGSGRLSDSSSIAALYLAGRHLRSVLNKKTRTRREAT